MPLRRFYLLLWVLLCGASASVMATERSSEVVSELEGITEYRLSNGLRVLLAPMESSSSIAFNMIYLSGSLEDPQGKGGTAHLLEHLLYRGTESLPGAQLAQALSQLGIQSNATTSYDRTRYHAVLSADQDKLDYLIALEAERMVKARFDQADLEGERDVVLREMAQHQDNPLNALTQSILASATPDQGLGRPVLGSQAELGRVGLDDVRAFYAQHYQPGNAVIVVTGRFDAAHTLREIERHFVALPGRPVAEPVALSLPTGPASVQVRGGSHEWLVLAYPLAGARAPGNIVLAPLSDILAAEPHGRLYQALMVADKGAGVVAQSVSFRGGGYQLFAVLLGEGQSMDEARGALIEQVEGLARQPLKVEELQRFQNTWKSVKTQVLRDPMLLANRLSEDVAVGDWRLFLDSHARVAELTVDKLQSQALAYFQPQRRLLGELRPGEGQAPAAQAPVVPAAAREGLTAKAVELPDAVDLEAFAESVELVERSIRRDTLDNGLKLALRQLPGASRPVEGILNLRFGDAESLAGKRALADLVGTLVLRGTQNRSYQQIVDQVIAMGSRLVIVPEDGGVLKVSFQVEREHLGEMLELIADILQKPAFQRTELHLVKRNWQSAWARPIGQPAAVAALSLGRQAAPWPVADIRRHFEPKERLAELKPLSRDDLLTFHRDFYGANHGEFALSGDFDPQAVREQVQRLFGSWNSKAKYARVAQPYRSVESARLHVRAQAPQAGHYLARLHFEFNAQSAENPALHIAEHILGRKPLVSRLSQRLREQENLSYDVRTSIKLATFDNDSWITIQADYPRGQGPRLADIVREEVACLIEHGIDEQELERAKRTILHERRLYFGQDANILSDMARQLYLGTNMISTWSGRNQAFAGVTLEQVNDAIRKHLRLEGFVEVLADAEGESWQ